MQVSDCLMFRGSYMHMGEATVSLALLTKKRETTSFTTCQPTRTSRWMVPNPKPKP